MRFNVEQIEMEDRNIKDNTEDKWEEVVQMFRGNKRKTEVSK